MLGVLLQLIHTPLPFHQLPYPPDSYKAGGPSPETGECHSLPSRVSEGNASSGLEGPKPSLCLHTAHPLGPALSQVVLYQVSRVDVEVDQEEG